MIIDKIAKLCKKAKYAKLYDQRTKDGTIEMQWLSNGKAVYPLFEAPLFDAMTLAATFDFKSDKMRIFHDTTLPENLNFADVDENEQECLRVETAVVVNGTVLCPYITKQGIAFFDEKLLAPLKDADAGQIRIYERYTEGSMYFAVKSGFMLYALVLPEEEVITPELVKDLDILKAHCETALFNKKRKLSATSGR